MRALSAFIYKTENEHIKIRNEIANFLKNNVSMFEEVLVPTEFGDMTIDEYIEWMRTPGNWGGEIEIYASQKIYNINVIAYKQCFNIITKKLDYKYIWCYMQDNNYNRDLCILINENNTYWNILIHKS